MYRHLSRAPSRTLSGHVCLSCRRQFHVTGPRQNDARDNAANEAADDWLSNFNDLSVSSESKPSRREERRQKRWEREEAREDAEAHREPLEKTEEGGTFDQLKARLNNVTLGEPTGELDRMMNPQKQVDNAQPKKTTGAGADEHESSDVREDYESVLAGIMAEEPTSLAATIKKHEAGGDAVRTKDYSKPKLFPRERRLSLDLPASSDRVKEQRALNGKRTGQESPIDEVAVTGGVVSPRARSLPPNDDPRQPMNAASKARMVKERPKWGGVSAPTETVGPPSKLSFSALQRADKVSAPKQRPATASSDRPWGFRANQAKGGFADTPGDLAVEQNPEAAAAELSAESNTPQPGTLRGMLGFKKLRNFLSGNPTKETADSQEAANANTTVASSIVDVLNDPLATRTEDATLKPPAEAESEAKSDGRDGLPDSQFISLSQQEGKDESTSQTPVADAPEEKLPSRRTLARKRRRQRLAERQDAEAFEQGWQTRRQRHLHLMEQHDQQRKLKELWKKRRVSANIAKDEPKSSESSEVGRSLQDVMAGRQFASAMSSQHDSGRAVEEEAYEEYDEEESGLPRIEAKDLEITALNIQQPPVPELSFGLDRVLFNPGVTSLQDQHSRVFNFDPYLQHIMPVEEFDFNALQQYKTSSQDATLSELAKSHGKKYVGSTSSMTSTLSHFHYLLSDWRDLNLKMLSRQFKEQSPTFTQINRAPTAIFLRWKNGTYAIDADKEHDTGNILMMLGKSMEKLLTLPKDEYERYRKSDPRVVTEEERNAPEAYQYTTMGDFLMRSQLDAHDPRLPGTGMFDIKTRAIASIRMSTTDYKPMLGYEIHSQQGDWESYEREYYDMMRSTMLKYMLQARMGRMDGIFLAYHNVQRIFGFQYMPIAEIDRAIHGQVDRCLGDQEFKLSLDLLNKVVDEATAKFPGKSLRFHFETRSVPVTAMYVFAEPMEEEQIDKLQAKSKARIADFERKMMGIEARDEPSSSSSVDPAPEEDEPQHLPPSPDSHAPLYAATIILASRVNGAHVTRPQNLKPSDSWSVSYLLKEISNPADAWASYEQCKAKRRRTFARAVATDDEGAEVPEDGEGGEGGEPNMEILDKDGSVRTFESVYLERLRRLAERGREFRREMDGLEGREGKVVFRDGVARAEDAAREKAGVEAVGRDAAGVKPSAAVEEPAIKGVADYMAWMYPARAAESAATGGEAEAEAAKEQEPVINGVGDYMEWMYKDPR